MMVAGNVARLPREHGSCSSANIARNSPAPPCVQPHLPSFTLFNLPPQYSLSNSDSVADMQQEQSDVRDVDPTSYLTT
jgi:hypothetical protein